MVLVADCELLGRADYGRLDEGFLVIEEQFEFVDAAGLAALEGVVHHRLQALHENCHQLLGVYSCRFVHVDLLGVDHFSNQRVVIALLHLIPAELLFQHFDLPSKRFIFFEFFEVLLIDLLVLNEHFLVVVVDFLLGWLLVVLGLAAHKGDVVDEVLRDVGFADTLKERLDGLDVLEVVTVDRQLRGLRAAEMPAGHQEPAGRRRDEVGLGGVAVGEVGLLPAVVDAQRVDVLRLVELLSGEVGSLIDDHIGGRIAADDGLLAHLCDCGLVVDGKGLQVGLDQVATGQHSSLDELSVLTHNSNRYNLIK